MHRVPPFCHPCKGRGPGKPRLDWTAFPNAIDRVWDTRPRSPPQSCLFARHRSTGASAHELKITGRPRPEPDEWDARATLGERGRWPYKSRGGLTPDIGFALLRPFTGQIRRNSFPTRYLPFPSLCSHWSSRRTMARWLGNICVLCCSCLSIPRVPHDLTVPPTSTPLTEPCVRMSG